MTDPPPPGPRRRASPLALAALAAALAVPVAVAALPLAHDDLFGHLATGRWIVEHGRVPTADRFSFTRTGAPWVSHEWGFSLLAFGVWRAGGSWALVGLSAGLALALFGTVAATARRRVPAEARTAADPLLAALLVGVAWAVSPELFLRAALAGAVCFALFAAGLVGFRDRPSPGRGAALAALVLVWANLHSGVVFGLALAALSALDALVLAGRRALPHLALAAACLGAALVNPHGIEALLYPFRLARLLADPASGFERGHFAGGWDGREAILGVVLAATLAGLLVLRRRGAFGRPPAGRGGAPLAGWELAALAVFGAGSWVTSRLSVELAVLLVPAATAVGGALLADRARTAGGSARPDRGGQVLAGAALAAACVLAGGTLAARPAGAVSPHFPSGAADFLRAHGLRGPTFHHQNWGGYLAWRLGIPVFWDGRNDVFAPLVRELAATPFAEVAERYGVEILVLSPREVRQLAPELASGRWGLVHLDRRSAVFLSRRAHSAALDRLEIRPPPRRGAPPPV